jgi:hypothetical protein
MPNISLPLRIHNPTFLPSDLPTFLASFYPIFILHPSSFSLSCFAFRYSLASRFGEPALSALRQAFCGTRYAQSGKRLALGAPRYALTAALCYRLTA